MAEGGGVASEYYLRLHLMHHIGQIIVLGNVACNIGFVRRA